MNEHWTKISLRRLSAELLPIAWRKPRMLAFVWSLITPLQIILFDFQSARKRNIYRVNHNWMKCYLQAALNDEFDPQERRITIDETFESNAYYIYTNSMLIDPDLSPKYLGTGYLRENAYYDANQDFVVNMHGVLANWDDVRALVDFYKMDGTRYLIKGLQEFQIP